MTIRDANFFWHATKRIGNRLVTLCGYINTDANNLERNGYTVSDTERPTCKRCVKELAKQVKSC